MATNGQKARNGDRPLSRLQTARGIRRFTAVDTIATIGMNVHTGPIRTAFARLLGATDFNIGVMGALPGAVQILQFFSPYFIQRLRRRKPLVSILAGLSYATWLPIALIPRYVAPSAQVAVFLLLLGISYIFQAVQVPAGMSWISDLVPGERRGRYYGRVGIIGGSLSLLAGIAAGAYIDRGRALDAGLPLHELGRNTVVLALVGILGVILGLLLFRVPEPPMKRTEEPPSMREVLTVPLRHAVFRREILFFSLFYFGVQLAGPYFALYMYDRQYLGMSYYGMAIALALTQIMLFLTTPLWGYLADKFGSAPILKIGNLGVTLLPLFWIAALPDKYWIVYAVHVVGGSFWGAFTIGQQKMLLASAPRENQSAYFGMWAGIMGVATFVGPVVGGGLLVALTRLGFGFQIQGYPILPIHVLFAISTMIRLLTAHLAPARIEAREASAAFVIRQVVATNPFRAISDILLLTHATSERARVQAARKLSLHRTPIAVEELVDALDDPSPIVRRLAAQALGETGDERAVDSLAAKIDHPEDDCVEDAVQALGKINGHAAYVQLRRVATDPRFERLARVRAISGLGERTEPDEVPDLLLEILEQETDSRIRAACAESLGRWGEARALPMLYDLMSSFANGVMTKQVAHAIACIFGEGHKFYVVLRSTPLERDYQVSQIVRTLGRRIGEREFGLPGDRRRFLAELRAIERGFERDRWDQVVLACARVWHLVRQRSQLPVDEALHHERQNGKTPHGMGRPPGMDAAEFLHMLEGATATGTPPVTDEAASVPGADQPPAKSMRLEDGLLALLCLRRLLYQRVHQARVLNKARAAADRLKPEFERRSLRDVLGEDMRFH